MYNINSLPMAINRVGSGHKVYLSVDDTKSKDLFMFIPYLKLGSTYSVKGRNNKDNALVIKSSAVEDNKVLAVVPSLYANSIQEGIEKYKKLITDQNREFYKNMHIEITVYKKSKSGNYLLDCEHRSIIFTKPIMKV